MTLIVCLDDRDGMLYNKRRQSRDFRVCERILERAAGNVLRMNAYSAKLFPEGSVQIDPDFLEKANLSDCCFVENVDILPYLDKAETLVIYRWNRVYPSDVKFPTVGLNENWHLQSSIDFPGNSHESITEEVYTR